MPDTPKMDENQFILAQIVLAPLEEEGDDIETLSALEDVRMDVWDEVSVLPGYTLQMVSDNTRDAGVIFVLGEIVREAITEKDLVLALFQAGTAAVGALAKHGHVKKIELKLDGDSISIEDADQATVQTLLDSFQARHPGKVEKLTTLSSLQVVGTVSLQQEQ